MGDNAVVILDNLLAKRKEELGASLADEVWFQLFTFEQALKEFDLSYDELLSGLVDGPDDGGIDGFFVFVNDDLLGEDLALDSFKRKSPLLRLFIIQAKRGASFEETALDRLRSTISDILALDRELPPVYNRALATKVEVFRKAYVGLAARHPVVSVRVIYASRGDTSQIHPKVKVKAEGLETEIARQLVGCEARVAFWGARELLEAARKERSYTLQLRLFENPISTGENGYVALVTLRDYFDFITDERGELRKYLFEANVRDYLGDVEVNRDIRETLERSDSLDFWWLNNGVTIISSKGSIVGKTITLDDVQIVNGLQTTTTIYEHFKNREVGEDKRCILVKIIVTDRSDARDRIVKATNFQNAVSPASLRAMDRIQRDIEDYFLQHGWFYDRRKNYYKNLGKPLERIISIPYLAQAIMAIVLREPHNSRARPSTLIKDENDYKRVYDEAWPLEVYLSAARLMRRVEEFLRSGTAVCNPEERTNMRFHLAMLATVRALGAKDYRASRLLELSQPFGDDFLGDCLRDLVALLSEYRSANGDPPIDQVAKSGKFTSFLLEKFPL